MEDQTYIMISEAEYREGIDDRVFPDEIEQNAWYKCRETSDEAKAYGSFAVEALVNVVYIDSKESAAELHLQPLDADAQTFGDEVKLSISEEGIMYDPFDPSSEGYLIDYDEYPDIKIEGVAERIMAFTQAGGKTES